MHQKGSIVPVLIILITIVSVLVILAFLNIPRLINLGYETEVETHDTDQKMSESSNKDLYGGVKLVHHEKYRKAGFPLNFPDGGVPFYLEDKIIFFQFDQNGELKYKVGEVALKPVQGTSGANIIEAKINWLTDQKFEYKITNGFAEAQHFTQTGQIELHSLPPAPTPVVTPRPLADPNSGSLVFQCADNKRFGVSFLSSGADLILTNGRRFLLPQVHSIADVKFIGNDIGLTFSINGKMAVIEEQGIETHKNCIQIKP